MATSKNSKSFFEGIDTSNIEKIFQEIEDLRKQIAGGLLDDIFEFTNEESYQVLRDFLKGDFDPEKLKRKVELAVEKMIRGGTTLKDAFGLTSESMEALYFMGYSMFQRRNYPASRQVFELLIQLDPFEGRYHHALAATQHKQKDFLAAIQNYTKAFIYSPVSDPELHFHCADCYLKMDDLMSAIIALGHCIEACDERYDIHRQIKARSTTLREILIKNLAEREQKKAQLQRDQELARKHGIEKASTYPSSSTSTS